MVSEKGKDLLLLVWVHGFKGNEVTFESFPDRICHLLESTHPSLQIVSRVFPMYQTRGELHAATLAFVDWLTTMVVGLENDHGAGGGAGKAKVVLLGHSMGGLLIADAARDVAFNTRPGAPLWPHIIGIIAFDTPYLGLHPHTFKNGLTTAASYYEQARNIASAAGMLSPLAIGLGVGKWGKKADDTSRTPSPAGPSNMGRQKSTDHSASVVGGDQLASDTNPTASGSKAVWPVPSTNMLYGLGAVALGAAAVGTAYYRREDFINGWKWGYDHMIFVKNLWDSDQMRERLEGIESLERDWGLIFVNYYTYLPPTPPTHTLSRTFCILPPTSLGLEKDFIQASNSRASDEVSAHMGMFDPKTNDGFYDLGLGLVRRIGEKVETEGVGRSGVKAGKADMMEESDGSKESGSLGQGWREEKDGDKVIWVDDGP